MCIFCVGDDTPFYLRKSTAFPRKMIAEAVDAEAVPCEQDKSAVVEAGQREATIQPSVSRNNALRGQSDA